MLTSVISVRKAKHLDVTTMFTYSHANMPLGQSERAYCLSYFIIGVIMDLFRLRRSDKTLYLKRGLHDGWSRL